MKNFLLILVALTLGTLSPAHAGDSNPKDPNSIQTVRCTSADPEYGDSAVTIDRVGDNQFEVKVVSTWPLVRNVTFKSGAAWSGTFWSFDDGAFPTDDSAYAIFFRTGASGTNSEILYIQGASHQIVVPSLGCAMN